MLKEKTKRVILSIPAPLLECSDEMASRLNVSRSELIREAVREYIKKVSAASLKKRLAEGYRANASLLKQVSKEFKFVDAENL